MSKSKAETAPEGVTSETCASPGAAATSEASAPEDELKQMARMFKALSNPHRLRIYRELASCVCGSVAKSPEEFRNCQCGFAERLGLAPSTVSHHFKELREAGLIHMKREAKTVLFWVDREAARKLRHVLNG